MTMKMKFWAALNDKLAATGLPEALYREVCFYWDHRMTVDQALQDLRRAAN